VLQSFDEREQRDGKDHEPDDGEKVSHEASVGPDLLIRI
jgi:hypothetical protein